MYPGILSEQMVACFQQVGKKLNYNMSDSCSNNDPELYLQQLEAAAASGKYDGFFLGLDTNIQDRITEILDEYKFPYVSIFNPMRDDGGANIAPTILLDGYSNGSRSIQWLYDNYKTYWGEIDPSKIALVDFTLSIVPDIQSRSDGAIDKFNELLPDNPQYTLDSLVGGVTADNAVNEVTTLVAGHPEIEYWWFMCGIEDLATGATRAIETLGKGDNVLIVTIGDVNLRAEWDGGYQDNTFVGCIAISNYLYAAPAAAGLVAMVDGRATMDTLWQERRAPGDKSTVWLVDSVFITRDTYKDYLSSVNAKYES
jgi:ABC-type sugar transport system substrate-binding protein